MSLLRLQEIIKNSEYDAILLTGLENPVAAKNLKYITGYSGTFGFAIITENKQFMISDFRYRQQVKLECPNFEIREIEGSFLKTIETVIQEVGIKKLGFDKKMRFSEYELYQKLEVELVPLQDVIESLRVSKTKEEVALLKKANEITEAALEYILTFDLIGMVERDVEAKLKMKMLELGADSTWDRFIIASGTRGSMPHGSASDKVIQNNEMVTFDIGCIYKGYSSDLTRTIAIGKVDPKLIEIYNVVLEAQTKACAEAKAGMTGQELDSICRDHITSKGYGEYFKHGTGHGLGLDIHEAPRASQANTEPLELGAVVTIEPGIYIEGLGGVRIEDDVYLTEDGCINLNEFTKELITK